MLLLLTVSLLCSGAVAVIYDLSDEDHARMPDIFHLDDYNSCMLRSDNMYCLLTLELHSESDNELYKLIQEYSADYLTHYNHSIVERGVCVYETCKHYFNETKQNKEYLVPTLEVCLNESISNQYGLNARVLTLHKCSKNNEEVEVTLQDWITATLVFGILVINIIGSLYHIWLGIDNLNEKNTSYLLLFSVFRNWKGLFRKETDDSKTVYLTGLHPVRTILSHMFLLGHSMLTITGFSYNVHYIEKVITNPGWRLVSHGANMIQFNFIISGFLVAYKMLNYESETKKNITYKHIPKMLLIRFIRLTPSYIVVILLTISWARHFGSGPLMSYYFGDILNDFHGFFWKHLFFLNNYMSEPVKSLLHTWYVAADTQMFIVGAVVLCSCRRRRPLMLAGLLVLSLGGPLADIWVKGAEPLTIVDTEFTRSFKPNLSILSHMAGHNQLTSYLVGMITGLLVFEWQKEGKEMKNKYLELLSHCIIPSLVCTVLSVGSFYSAAGLPPSTAAKILAAVSIRVVQLSLLACLLITIVMKINSVMFAGAAWRGWLAPSRIAYGVYLVHYALVVGSAARHSARVEFSVMQLVYNWCGVTAVSVALATLLYLLVEAPCLALLKNTLAQEKHKQKQQ